MRMRLPNEDLPSPGTRVINNKGERISFSAALRREHWMMNYAMRQYFHTDLNPNRFDTLHQDTWSATAWKHKELARVHTGQNRYAMRKLLESVGLTPEIVDTTFNSVRVWED